jgi:hypothetical protein
VPVRVPTEQNKPEIKNFLNLYINSNQTEAYILSNDKKEILGFCSKKLYSRIILILKKDGLNWNSYFKYYNQSRIPTITDVNKKSMWTVSNFVILKGLSL